VFGKRKAAAAGVDPEAAIPVGTAKAGKAVIQANVQGDRVDTYDIEILNVLSNPVDSRDMVIAVTDRELIGLTGGIVQGMSGSPIIQDGKLVGAVTHVLLNDARKGYGISIETMLEAAE
jgi:stage IV sporulation protein B